MRVTDTHYFFYQHEFGQWTKRMMVDNQGIFYNCCEQYMMYQKAILFGDNEIAEEILEETNPRTQKNLGRKVKNYDQTLWDTWKFNIVFSGNLLKFTQHDDLKKRLIDSYPRKLVEASPVDTIWGVGLAAGNDAILDEKNWRGQNLLGECLMAVRDVLMRENK